MKKKIEFSKQILGVVMLTYFIGVVIGSYIVIKLDPMQLGVYLAFLGTPTSVAIGFYAWKAKAENLIKLGKPIENIDDTNISPHNMYQGGINQW